MKKSILITLSVVLLLGLALAGCSKLEVYDRNLQYMTSTTFQAEKEALARDMEIAQAQLAQAQASGDAQRIKDAQSRVKDLESKARSIKWEERRRNRTW